ncbi:hypothetical protein CO111_05720 [Candidatus Desantisbacteria bacterium CG_4_9_14_3_um_filter_50_7]|nr:MAG: hypothetical protein CO111_05720 [Candidatus Desantisbacteria bacterium CG_4_9_14_3_um_filter_50_7]
MDARKEKILNAIVKEYVKNPKPVSSKILARKLGLSSATLRNEMMELEKNGYLEKPHTSAGRIPTDKAYREFIKSLDGKEIKVPIKKRDKEICLSLFFSSAPSYRLFPIL